MLLGLVLAAPLVAFGPSLSGGFVWDDRDLIVESPAMATLRPLGRFFAGDFWSQGGAPRQSGYYRPLTLLTYALERSLWGLQPLPFRITNLLLHAAAGLLALALGRGLGLARIPATLVALAFAVHPVHAESVAWISGRTDLMASVLGMAALVLCLPPRRLAWLPVACLLLLGSLLSKESSAALPLLVLLPAFGSWTRRLTVWAALVTTLGAYATLRLQVLGPPGLPSTAPLAARLGDAGKVLIAQALEVLWPAAMPVDRQVAPSGEAAPAYILLLVTVPLAGAWLASRGRLEGAGILLFFLGLLPTLGIVPIHENAAIRFLYLPCLGILLALAPAVMLLARSQLPAAAAVVALALAGMTYLAASRSRDFTSDEALFAAERRLSPGSVRMAMNLGETLRRQGRHAETAAYYQRLRSEGLDVAPVNVAIVRSLREAGDLDGSARASQDVLARFPGDASAHSEAGLTLVAQGYRALAREQWEIAVSLDATAIAPRVNLALLFTQMGRYDEALASLEPGLSRQPASRELLHARAHALHRAGRYDEAVPLLTDLSVAHPDRVEIWLELADAAFASGRYEASRRACTMARTLVPTDTRPLQQLARLALATGQTAEAIAALRKAVEIDPAREARLALAQVLWQAGERGAAREEIEAAAAAWPQDPSVRALRELMSAEASAP